MSLLFASYTATEAQPPLSATNFRPTVSNSTINNAETDFLVRSGEPHPHPGNNSRLVWFPSRTTSLRCLITKIEMFPGLRPGTLFLGAHQLAARLTRRRQVQPKSQQKCSRDRRRGCIAGWPGGRHQAAPVQAPRKPSQGPSWTEARNNSTFS